MRRTHACRAFLESCDTPPRSRTASAARGLRRGRAVARRPRFTEIRPLAAEAVRERGGVSQLSRNAHDTTTDQLCPPLLRRQGRVSVLPVHGPCLVHLLERSRISPRGTTKKLFARAYPPRPSPRTLSARGSSQVREERFIAVIADPGAFKEASAARGLISVKRGRRATARPLR
jgi:hypothetical protein